MSGRASCNICGEETFGDTYGPPDSTGVRCVFCSSPECHGLLLELLTIKDLQSGMRKVLHLAPEVSLALLRERFVACYFGGDKTSEQHNIPGVLRLDLFAGLDRFEPESSHLVNHNQVLEHVACDYKQVTRPLHELGSHPFPIPILLGGFREDLERHSGTDRSGLIGGITCASSRPTISARRGARCFAFLNDAMRHCICRPTPCTRPISRKAAGPA
ncbi:hypothetical protein CDO26_20005 (plasmid) [Sinorhizobium meliloti]|uniref:hypothetical protein n=1 Tax=Rhizobium meliloti TaxID=382 RepID=UPI000B49E6D6|nr:hypothetical protein [Sinorhizobium meliloti]ASP86857.1 hypothetical protein CDO26_20005 [Sinorhizobium meliloti]MQW25531.1 hypothetical protein [Sinorhizobium meliloti]